VDKFALPEIAVQGLREYSTFRCFRDKFNFSGNGC